MPIDADLREEILKLGSYQPEGNFQKDPKGFHLIIVSYARQDRRSKGNGRAIQHDFMLLTVRSLDILSIVHAWDRTVYYCQWGSPLRAHCQWGSPLRAHCQWGLRFIAGGQSIGSWPACYEFEPSTTKDPPYKGAMYIKYVKSLSPLPLVW
ncbi:hypothetical protein TNCV_2183351 [Trichonephila clavipes]|nr:hypothetical protein TNCV_2183351 [Trichonephila clavipes]